MSRKRGGNNHHNPSGWVLLAAGAAGAALGYRDRLVFAVGIGAVIGFIIGYAIASRMKNQVIYSTVPEPPPRAEVRARPAPRKELQRARRNGWEPPARKDRMISLSPECLGREECLACTDNGCQCPCGHDPARIVAWNAQHYDAEHELEPAGEHQTAPEDEEMPF